MQHPSILASIARHNPYAAASIAASSRTGRSAAQRVATMAAATAARTARRWSHLSKIYRYRTLYKEARLLYDLPTGEFERAAERMGYYELHNMFYKHVTDSSGGQWVVKVDKHPRFGGIKITSQPNPNSQQYWSVELTTGDPYYSGQVPQHARSFFRRTTLNV